MRVSHLLRRGALPALALAAVSLIAACGDASQEAETTTRPAVAERAGERETSTAATVRKAIEGKRPEQGGGKQQGGVKAGGGKETGNPKQGDARNEPGQGSERHPGSKGDAGSARTCSRSGARSCAEIGAAYEQAKQEDPRVVAPDECPPSMSEAQCAEAGRVAAEAAGESRIVKPTECPPAMTDEQCEEAGRAYQEALR